MKVIVTGSSNGIGAACVDKFLQEGHEVIGIDVAHQTCWEQHYEHIQCDVSAALPEISDVEILINNAGVQDTLRDIDINLKGVINCTAQYGLQPKIKSIVNLASVSAHNGAEFGLYCASKGGVLSYTKWTAKEIAKYGATCNSISFGGVITNLNRKVISDEAKWNQIMDLTPLKKWATAEEAAEWIYFVAVNNKSMSGQDIIVDNLEMLNHQFVW